MAGILHSITINQNDVNYAKSCGSGKRAIAKAIARNFPASNHVAVSRQAIGIGMAIYKNTHRLYDYIDGLSVDPNAKPQTILLKPQGKCGIAELVTNLNQCSEEEVHSFFTVV